LQNAGFDLLSLANNHSLDLGESGLKETIGRLAGVGIKTIGTGNNFDSAYRPAIIEVRGIRIAFLAIDAIPEPFSAERTGIELKRATWDKTRVLATIHRLDPISDAIIVLIHWGDEYELRAGLSQRQAAEEMVAAGADAVIGSHPHVVQETQVLAKKADPAESFVAYSLGNLVFDQFEENSRIGLALRLFVDQAGLKAVEAFPLHAGPEPELLAPAESQKLIERIRPEPAWISFRCNQVTCLPVRAEPGNGIGLFTSGQIDLDGNGILETVRLENGRVSVFEADRLGWESPPEWHVLDVALGDPNDDGRGELMLVLQKLDKNGKTASHPFMIGHRGGIYRQVWGGSAVAIPIQEVELADVDGDGKQELIVLEEQSDGMKTISVLKWDDWVFRLFWRSAPSRFVNLQVQNTEEHQPVITIGQVK
jgi:poly-gamma-glutamate synthesis protein (capsule biosynthesis protein)